MFVAEQDDFLNVRAFLDRGLNRGWRDILAICKNDNVLLAVGDFEVATFVGADITGMQPALGVNHVPGCLWIVEVTLHHILATVADLAICSDQDFSTFDDGTDGAYLLLANGIDRDNRAGFCQPVAFEEVEAKGDKEAGCIWVQCCAA